MIEEVVEPWMRESFGLMFRVWICCWLGIGVCLGFQNQSVEASATDVQRDYRFVQIGDFALMAQVVLANTMFARANNQGSYCHISGPAPAQLALPAFCADPVHTFRLTCTLQ